AYQEQSTRALPFTMENLGMPYEVKGTEYETKMLTLSQKEIDLYQKIYDKIIFHLNEKFAHLRVKADEDVEARSGVAGAKLSDREWNGIIAAKAFDVARYLLPQNMTTSLGVTLNTRRFMDQLSEWQSSELMEMRVLGRVAQAESMLISPMLMKHGNRSDYHARIPAAVRAVSKKHLAGKLKPMPYKHYDVESRLLEAPENLQELVLASILFSQTDGSVAIDDIAEQVKGLSFEQKREIAESACAGKETFEIFSKIMECGAVVFERLYDIGAFRDLQRQRGDRQQYNRYGVVGYNMPKEVKEIGLESEFVSVMNDVKALYDEMISKGMYSAAQYVPVMANTLRHVVTKDVVQCFYEAKLRSQPAGIDSYRTIAIQEIEQLLDKMPAFKGLVPYTSEYHDLGRLPEAIRICADRYKAKAEKKAKA
ncbi:FAD-dependent thymidylate synthase, partial [Candidatus Woesearchaeota archaeon]|nr:FAD-dependent thymidylate synthase [Candidatus Woesearchaeota archaeon]